MNSPSVDQLSSVLAAVCISVIAVASFLILPVFVSAVAADMGLSERQIGFMASGIMSGSALSSVLAIFWTRRVDWRLAGYGSLGLLLAAHTASLLANNFTLFMLCQFLAGLGGGAAYSLALTALSDNRHPDRCFGFSIAAQVTFQVIGMLALPAVIAGSGLKGLLTVFIALEIVALLLLSYLPRSGVETSREPLGRALFRPRVLAALAGCFFFFFNVGAVWTYVERMGVNARLNPEFITIGLAVGVSLGIPGALLASLVGDRFGRVGPLALGAVMTLLALFLLAGDLGKVDYLVALALYNFAWNFSLAFQYAAVNAADSSGRSVAAAPAFHGAGGAVGPGVAALLVTSDSLLAVNLLAAGAVVLSLLLFAASAASHRLAAPTTN